MQIPLVQGVLRGNKKARIRGLDRGDKTKWGGRRDLNPRPPGPQDSDLSSFECFGYDWLFYPEKLRSSQGGDNNAGIQRNSRQTESLLFMETP